MAKGADIGRAAVGVKNCWAFDPIDCHDFFVLETIDLDRRDVDMGMDIEMVDESRAGITSHTGPTMPAAVGQVITADIDADYYPRI
jgi:hypothetical protein